MVIPGDVDALEVARTQLHMALVVADTQSMTLEARLQLGLLASNIALAERLPTRGGIREDSLQDGEAFSWTPANVEQFLHNLSPEGRQLIEILISEGGTATPGRVKELTGRKSLASITSSLRRASHRTAPNQLPPPCLVEVVRTHRTDKALLYRLGEDVMPIVAAAFERLGSAEEAGAYVRTSAG